MTASIVCGMTDTLPPGQREIRDFPRFGLTPFAKRFPRELHRVSLRLECAGVEPFAPEAELAALPRFEITRDFHCVTTWTRRGLTWSGWRFRDFHERLVAPRLSGTTALVVLRGQDGAHSSLPLEDLLAEDVLLADRLDGAPLTIEHGAPLRLVAPAHYGYKSVKHLHRIEYRAEAESYRPVGLRFMAHPRARVALEERGQWIPGWVLRRLYRPLIAPTVKRFRREMERYRAADSRGGT